MKRSISRMVTSLEEDKDCRSYLDWTAQSRPTSPSPQKQVGRQSIQLETHDVDQQSKDILGHRENRRQRHPASSEYRQLCVDRPTFDEASLSPPIMIGHPRIDHNYLQEHDCSINLCLWNAGRSGQRQRKALLILHEESFNNAMRLDWESSQHLHGTSQSESIVMETSTLPIQSLLPTKFAGLSPTLRRHMCDTGNSVVVLREFTYIDEGFLDRPYRGDTSFSLLHI